MKTSIFLSVCFSLLAPQLSVALPAVVDANSAWTAGQAQQFAVSQDQNLDAAQRLVILEQSLNNINQMDLPGQIERLQQDMQQLRGQVDELQRHLMAKQVTPASVAVPAPLVAEKPVSVASAPVPAVNPELAPQDQAQRTYDAAFSLVRSGSYADAIHAFNSFLQIYGDDNEHSVNAYYWLGELHAYQHEYTQANDALSRVVTQYPKSNKVPDAMLKLGIVNQKLGDQTKANEWFTQLIERYPDSNAARMAKSYLR